MHFNAISFTTIAAALLAPSLVHAAIAYGTVEGKAAGSKLEGRFDIDGSTYVFFAEFFTAPGIFASSNARLVYDHVAQLRGQPQKVEGSVGPDELKLNLKNGPIIIGELDEPTYSKSILRGNGNWKIQEKESHYCGRY